MLFYCRGARVMVAVTVMRRVGVIVGRAPADVKVTLGAGFVKSTVGVSVGGSRVGIGACVGVATSEPRGKVRIVGGGCVAVATWVGRATNVGVGGRCKEGRTSKLNVPAQYNTPKPIKKITKQPYPICCPSGKFQNPRGGKDSG